jgi:hypothetical protein
VASRAATQRKWRAKPENLWYARQEQKLAESVAQSAKLADLGPAAPLRDKKLPNEPALMGVLAVLRGSTRVNQIAEFYGNLLATGHAILLAQAAGEARLAERVARNARRQT